LMKSVHSSLFIDEEGDDEDVDYEDA